MDFSFLTFRSERFRADRWHFARGERALDGILKVTESSLCACQGIKPVRAKKARRTRKEKASVFSVR